MALIRKRKIIIVFVMSLSLLFGYAPTEAIAISQPNLDMLYEDYHDEDPNSFYKPAIDSGSKKLSMIPINPVEEYYKDKINDVTQNYIDDMRDFYHTLSESENDFEEVYYQSDEEVEIAYCAFNNLYPGIGGSRGSKKKDGHVVHYLGYNKEAFQKQVRENEIMSKKIDEIIKNLNITADMTEYEAVYRVYNWFLFGIREGKGIEYDHIYERTEPYDVLTDGIGICYSFSIAMKMILNKIGIECYMVGANTLNHEWNRVKIDNCWYEMDITWESSNKNDENEASGGKKKMMAKNWSDGSSSSYKSCYFLLDDIHMRYSHRSAADREQDAKKTIAEVKAELNNRYSDSILLGETLLNFNDILSELAATPKYTIQYTDEGNNQYNKRSAYEDQVITLTDAKKDGYTFEGWYLDKDYQQRVTSLHITGNICVYGKWRKKEPEQDRRNEDDEKKKQNLVSINAAPIEIKIDRKEMVSRKGVAKKKIKNAIDYIIVKKKGKKQKMIIEIQYFPEKF